MRKLLIIKTLNQCVKSYNMRNPMKLLVENPVKLFVDNPVKLFIYSTIVGNK